MADALPDIAPDVRERVPLELLEELADLARVESSRRGLFQNLTIEAVSHAWGHKPQVERYDPASIDELERWVTEIDRLCRSVESLPRLMRLRDDLLDDKLMEYIGSLRNALLPAASHVLAEANDKKRPRGGQMRSVRDGHCSPYEVLAAEVYRAARGSSGTLTLNKNATTDDTHAGTLVTTLKKLSPYLPEGFDRDFPPLGALNRIRKEVDDEFAKMRDSLS